MHNISEITSEKIADEVNEEVMKNTILNGIGRAFLDIYPQYYDIVSTYEAALDGMIDIITKETTVNKQIRINDDLTAALHINCEHARIYCPDDPIALKYAPEIATSPNNALANKLTYSCLIVADLVCKYTIGANPSKITDKKQWKSISDSFYGTGAENKMTRVVIPDGIVIQVPIPIGCKYCALRHFDDLTLRRTGEEMKEFYGFFVVEGFIRYILPTYKKPMNKPIVQKNTHEDQLSRTDVIYSKKFDYEDSYYIIASMVRNKSSNAGRKVLHESYPDFGCSLQLAHPLMNTNISDGTKRHKKLWNFVPIRYLFYAFGCKNDKELLQYIHPEMNNILFMNLIKNACVFGHKHLEALDVANVDRKNEGTYVRLLQPLDMKLALYIIGCIILNDDCKNEALKRVDGNSELYKAQIIEITSQILDERFMPGVGANTYIDRNEAICIELGNIVRKLYLIGYGFEPSQDKTSLSNRRVRSGQQCTREFKAFYKKRLSGMVETIDKLFHNIKFAQSVMPNINEEITKTVQKLAELASADQTRSLVNSFKGASKENSKLRTDIIQPKNIGFVWNKLREITITQDTSTIGADVGWAHRTVHPSELFFICPTQTPEAGDQCGRFKTPTIYTYVTLSTDPQKVVTVIETHKEVTPYRVSTCDPSDTYTVKLNGSCIGWVNNTAEALYEDLMQARRDGRVDKDISIILTHNQHEINVWTDIGRLMSPFVNVSKAFNVEPIPNDDNFTLGCKYSTKKDFSEWLKRINEDASAYDEGLEKGYIDLIDPDMAITNCVIADCIKTFYKNPLNYTHIALPGHIHGVIANIVPGINTVSAVRASYLTNHVKQAIGPTIRYPQCKYMALNNVLISPEVPLVRSSLYDYMHIGEHAIGQNVIVAFMQYKDNQEDAIIVNQASAEQGFLEIDSMMAYEEKVENSSDIFQLPDVKSNHIGNSKGYDNLDPQTCLPKDVSLFFNQNDPLIGKCKLNTGNYVTNKNEQSKVVDNSVINELLDGSYEHTVNPRYLRSVVKNSQLDHNDTYKKATFGRYCVSIAGDKFNPEYCQKGTIGKVMNVDEIPYATNGMRPDIIFNPPSVFKRKTYGQIYYPIIAKMAAVMGCPLDVTAYHTMRTTDDVVALLKRIGLDDCGFETMYSPITGRAFKYRIFLAPHYWERQAHLVESKINVRNGGPRNNITGQPLKGRKKLGGQSFDHMTFDAQIAQGSIDVIRDFHINQGSKMNIGVCQRCHSMTAYYDKKSKVWVCPTCGPHPEIIVKEIPPATNLMLSIFNGLHIDIEYYNDLETYKHANISNADLVNDKVLHNSMRIATYRSYLDAYNFVHRNKHNVVIAGDENEAVNRKPYTPLKLEDIIPNLDDPNKPFDEKEFYDELENKMQTHIENEKKVAHDE